MDNNDIFRLCREAIQVARDESDVNRADELLARASKACGLLEIPLIGFGEAGRIACADTARALIQERMKRGLSTNANIPEGFDFDDPYGWWNREGKYG